MLMSHRTTCSPSVDEEGKLPPTSAVTTPVISAPSPTALMPPLPPATPCLWYSMLRVSLDSWITATLPLKRKIFAEASTAGSNRERSVTPRRKTPLVFRKRYRTHKAHKNFSTSTGGVRNVAHPGQCEHASKKSSRAGRGARLSCMPPSFNHE